MIAKVMKGCRILRPRPSCFGPLLHNKIAGHESKLYLW
jgi:hypothetical protein